MGYVTNKDTDLSLLRLALSVCGLYLQSRYSDIDILEWVLILMSSLNSLA